MCPHSASAAICGSPIIRNGRIPRNANCIAAMLEGVMTMALNAVLAHPTGTTEMVLRRMLWEEQATV